jgi:hypothetical protein
MTAPKFDPASYGVTAAEAAAGFAKLAEEVRKATPGRHRRGVPVDSPSRVDRWLVGRHRLGLPPTVYAYEPRGRLAGPRTS